MYAVENICRLKYKLLIEIGEQIENKCLSRGFIFFRIIPAFTLSACRESKIWYYHQESHCHKQVLSILGEGSFCFVVMFSTVTQSSETLKKVRVRR